MIGVIKQEQTSAETKEVNVNLNEDQFAQERLEAELAKKRKEQEEKERAERQARYEREAQKSSSTGFFGLFSMGSSNQRSAPRSVGMAMESRGRKMKKSAARCAAPPREARAEMMMGAAMDMDIDDEVDQLGSIMQEAMMVKASYKESAARCISDDDESQEESGGDSPVNAMSIPEPDESKVESKTAK